MVIEHLFKPIKESKFNRFCKLFRPELRNFHPCTVDIEITEPDNYYIPESLDRVENFKDSVIIRIDDLMYSKITNELTVDSIYRINYYKGLIWYKGPFDFKVIQVPVVTNSPYNNMVEPKPWSHTGYLRINIKINTNEYVVPENAIIDKLDSYGEYVMVTVPMKVNIFAHDRFDLYRGHSLSNDELEFLEVYVKSIIKK